MELEALSGAIIRGAATIEMRDARTGAVDIWHGPNNVVDGGFTLLLERLLGTTGASPMVAMALGDGTGSFPGSETAMYHEWRRGTLTQASVATNVLTLKQYHTTSVSGIIREIGLANSAASGAGTLIAHARVNPSQTKTTAKEMVVTYTITLSRV